MELEIKKDNSSVDFSYFNENNSIFNDHDKLDYNSESDKKSASTSDESENGEEMEKHLLSKGLYNEILNDKDIDYDFNKKKHVDKLDLNSKPFVPKRKLFNINNKNFGCINNNYNNNIKKDKNKKTKKKKKNFCEKEGDWTCYVCKNLNFSFRDVCNICKLSKIESDEKYDEAFKMLQKLYCVNIQNTHNNDKKR